MSRPRRPGRNQRNEIRVYEDADSVEECKQEFLDELKDNIGMEHLDASTDEEEDDEQAKKGGGRMSDMSNRNFQQTRAPSSVQAGDG